MRLQPQEAIGDMKAKPQSPEAGGLMGVKPPALDAFCIFFFFSIKITHFYAYFGQNIDFEVITLSIKAFEKQSKRTK